MAKKKKKKKSSTNDSNPSTILRQCIYIYLLFLTNSIDYTICKNVFLYELKRSEVIFLFIKENPLKKENFRPLSLLTHITKVFERLIYKQIKNYIELIFKILMEHETLWLQC